MENLKNILDKNGGNRAPLEDQDQKLRNFLRQKYRRQSFPKLAENFEAAKAYFKQFLIASLKQAGFGAIRVESKEYPFKQAWGAMVFPMQKEKIEVFDQLIRYFFRLEGPLDLAKGIYLVGDIGVGKTRLLSVFRDLLAFQKTSHRFLIDSAQEVIETARDNPNTLKKYYQKNRLFDDIGHDAFVVKNYGNEIMPFDTLISERYRAFIKSGQVTHFSSNIFLTEDDPQISSLAHFLQPKTIDRLKEMVQVIELPGRSLRSNVENLNNY